MATEDSRMDGEVHAARNEGSAIRENMIARKMTTLYGELGGDEDRARGGC